MANNPRILVVDDDPKICRLLINFLRPEGFDVCSAGCGDEMWHSIKHRLPDIVILDMMLPGENGLTLAGNLRKQSDLGIIFLTGKKDIVDKIVGLEIGADDYLVKPFDRRELLARIRSVYRRICSRQQKPLSSGTRFIVFDGWKIDCQNNTLIASDAKILKLTDLEFAVLSYLSMNPGQDLSRDQILKQVSGKEWNPTIRSVDVIIGKLRKKLHDAADSARYIKTARNKGYRFIAAVSYE